MSPIDLPPEGRTPLPYAFPLVPSTLRPVPPATPAKTAAPAPAPTDQHTITPSQKPNNNALSA